MDFTAPLIFISIFVLASISLFLVYKYGIKKKSYEEALAEHRKQTSALLGPKPKPKEKKNKKSAKKINKEKANANAVPETETADEAESVDVKEIPENTEVVKEVVKVQPQSKGNGSKGKNSSKQNKTHVEFIEEPQEVPVEIPAEKEIKEVINKREDVPKPEAPKEEKKPEQKSKKNKAQKHDNQQQVAKNGAAGEPSAATVEKEKLKEEHVVENIVSLPTHEPVVNTGKEKKKKKSEFNSRQQMTAERDQLIYSVRNAELSRTENQLLIDLLLNKQLEAPTVIDDWSEGKFDPVQKLKKQLADKEKQLADEQETLVGVQAKLKEVRSEQLADRAQLQQKFRASEESKVEIIAAHNRLLQKIQELEEYRNKELSNFQLVVEENKALQMQRGQLEATLMNYQETDALIHNLKTENAHLTNELQLLTQEMQEQVKNYQNCVIQIQTLQEELRVTSEYVKSMEMNHSFALSAQQEETRSVAEQLQRTTETYLNEEQHLKDVIAQLNAEKQKLQEENSVQINGSSEENKEHKVKVLNLSNQLSSVKSELGTVSQTLLDAERQYETDLSSSQDKYNQLKRELEEQKNKNNELASEIKTREQNAQKEFVQRLFPEIDSLKSVSTDNWQDECEKVIRQHVSQLQQKSSPPSSPDQSAEVSKLHSEVQHYKKIIDETEGILKKLESHIEQEERNWRTELTQRDAEIQELKTQRTSQESQLQVQVSTLENQLAQEHTELTRLLEERQQSLNRPEVKTVHSDATATIEKLSEEVDRLREQLKVEQTKNSAASVYQNGETS